MWFHCLGLNAALLSGALFASDSGELEAPVPIMAAGKPIDVQHDGHAAPFVGDFDGDGVMDLLVGQYHEGRLRIYRNIGTNSNPKFDTYTWFKAGGDFGKVPVG
jgi:hypothetical protein